MTVLLVLSLATLANARTRSASDAGTYIAPGVVGSQARASAIPDGFGGAYVGFETIITSSAGNTGYAAVARIGPDGAPHPDWTTHPVASLVGNSGISIPVGVAPAAPGSAWLFSDWTQTGDLLYGLIHGVSPEDLAVTGTAPSIWNFGTGLAWADDRTFAVGVGSAFSNQVAILRAGLLSQTGDLVLSTPDISLLGTWGGSSTLIGDGAGGALVVADVINIGATSQRDVVAVRFQSDGQPAWSPPAKVVTQAPRDQAASSICGDGVGGAFFAWADGRDLAASQDVYAMHLLPDGNRASGWALNGNRLTAQPGDQFEVKLAEDGVGGCWLVWTDSRSGLNQIYFTRLKGDGSPAPGYVLGGRALAAVPGSQIEPAIVADGAGGFFCAWLDIRNGNLDLYGQHIHATGVVMPGWDADGTALCTEPSPQQDPSLVLSSPNHALVVWSDTRVTAPQYYAMALPEDGAITGVGPSVGAGLRLASAGARRELEFSLSATDAGEIRLEVFDASGRRVAEERRQGPLSDERVRITAASLRPGLYLARAGQHGVTAVSRALLIR
jgi:hypothetical protein